MTIDTATILRDTEEADTEERVQEQGGRTTEKVRSGPGRLIDRLAEMGKRTTTVTVTVLAVLLCAGVATSVVLARSTAEHAAVADAARAARDAAQSKVPAVLSYDFNTVDTTFPQLAQNLTGEFRDDYAALGANVIIPAARQDSIVTTATVVGNSVVTAGENEVVLLLFLNQETTSARYEGPRLDGSRVRVTMTEDAGEWLISEITPV